MDATKLGSLFSAGGAALVVAVAGWWVLTGHSLALVQLLGVGALVELYNYRNGTEHLRLG